MGVRSAVERFERFVSPEPNTGCWLWTGALQTRGYGSFGVSNGKTVLAHRWAYEHFVGPIPDGLTLDHLCRERTCVRPEHLEPVSIGENTRRASVLITHCKGGGHPLSGPNLFFRRGHRQCRACKRESSRAHYWRTRGPAALSSGAQR